MRRLEHLSSERAVSFDTCIGTEDGTHAADREKDSVKESLT
jgi:hypothetical protein